MQPSRGRRVLEHVSLMGHARIKSEIPVQSVLLSTVCRCPFCKRTVVREASLHTIYSVHVLLAQSHFLAAEAS